MTWTNLAASEPGDDLVELALILVECCSVDASHRAERHTAATIASHHGLQPGQALPQNPVFPLELAEVNARIFGHFNRRPGNPGD